MLKNNEFEINYSFSKSRFSNYMNKWGSFWKRRWYDNINANFRDFDLVQLLFLGNNFLATKWNSLTTRGKGGKWGFTKSESKFLALLMPKTVISQTKNQWLIVLRKFWSFLLAGSSYLPYKNDHMKSWFISRGFIASL